MKTSYIQIRVDAETKAEIEQAARSLGLTITSYITMLHKNEIKKGLGD